MISIEAIVAMSENRVIGDRGALPWKSIPSDMEHFRTMTMDQVVIMGRKTCESLPNPLGGRHVIGLSATSRRIPFVQEVAANFAEAMLLALRQATKSPNTTKIMIAGGETLYRAALNWEILSAINLTVVEGNYNGDAIMPEFEADFLEMIEDKENADYAAYRKVAVGVTFRRFVRKARVAQHILTRRSKNKSVRMPGAEQPII